MCVCDICYCLCQMIMDIVFFATGYSLTEIEDLLHQSRQGTLPSYVHPFGPMRWSHDMYTIRNIHIHLIHTLLIIIYISIYTSFIHLGKHSPCRNYMNIPFPIMNIPVWFVSAVPPFSGGNLLGVLEIFSDTFGCKRIKRG